MLKEGIWGKTHTIWQDLQLLVTKLNIAAYEAKQSK
jgi:hypothetical protein